MSELSLYSKDEGGAELVRNNVKQVTIKNKK